MRWCHGAVLLLLWVCVAELNPAAAAPFSVSSPGDTPPSIAALMTPEEQNGVKSARSVGMMMQMTFFGGNNFQLWFEGFHVHNAGTLTAACFGVAIMAILYEGLKVFRIILVDRVSSSSYSSLGHWLQVFLHIVQVTFSYFLMLATMTYSSWIMISVCAGAGLGFAIFGLMVPKTRLLGATAEHCH